MAYKVSYFTFKGLGEPVRFMLAYGNVEWEDNRVEFEDWPALKPSLPLHQMPVLEADGRIFHQSMSICRYLGNKFGLVGSNALENYEIDVAAETVNELRGKITMWYYTIKTKDEYYEKLIKEVIPFYLGKLEEQAKKNGGSLAINKITWADVYAVALFEYCSSLLENDLIEGYGNLNKIYQKVMSAEGVKKYLAKRPADRNPLV